MKNLTTCCLIFFLWIPATCCRAQRSVPRITINSLGHSSKIHNLLFTPDGARIISISEDKTIKIWNASTGEMLRKLEPQSGDGAEGILYASAISPDGKLLAVGGFQLTPDQKVYISIINLTTSRQIASAAGHSGAINSLAFTSNGNHLISGSDDGTVRVWKVSGLTDSFPNEATINAGGRVKFFSLNPVTLEVAVVVEGKNMTDIYNVSGVERGSAPFLSRSIGRQGSEVNKVAYSADGRYLAVSSIDRNVIICRSDGFLLREFTTGRPINAIAFSADSKILVLLDDKGEGISYGLPAFNVFTRFSGHDNTVFCAAFSPSDTENYSVASAGGNDNEIVLWNSISGKIIRRIKGKGRGIHNIAFGYGLDLAISQSPPNEKNPLTTAFDFGVMKLTPASNSKNTVLEKTSRAFVQSSEYTLELPSGKHLVNDRAVDGRILDFAFVENGIIVASDFSLKMYDPKGYYLKEFVGHTGGVRTVSVSRDGRYLASGSEDQTIILWKIAETGDALSLRDYFPGEKWAAFFHSLPVDSLTTMPSKAAWKSVLDFLKANNNRTARTLEEAYRNLGETVLPFVTLFITDDNEWVCWSPEGYFSCSSSGSKYFGWHLNKGMGSLADYYTADQYFDILYWPRQMERSINECRRMEEILSEEGERIFDLSKLHKPSAAFFDASPLLDSGKIEYLLGRLVTKEKSLKLKVNAFDGGGGIKEINIYQNDKLIISDRGAKGAFVKQINKTYNVDLVNEINEFRLIVVNYQKIESHPELLKVEYIGEIMTTSSLHMLIVGINKYKNAEYNLNYAQTDASSFAEKLASQSNRIFKSINKVEIYDEQATKENIIKGFTSIAATAKPEDVFVFFYAGHGSLNVQAGEDDPASSFYFIPTDVTKLYGDSEQLSAKGFSADEMRDNLINIRCTKQIVLMDACHSGGALKSLKVRNLAGDEKAIVQLARSSGIACIASSGTKQFATEFDELKHGVFTFVLLEALAGLADPNDLTLTVNKLKIYMEGRVPELTKQYGGTAQYPTGYINGSDFPIAVFEKKELKK